MNGLRAQLLTQSVTPATIAALQAEIDALELSVLTIDDTISQLPTGIDALSTLATAFTTSSTHTTFQDDGLTVTPVSETVLHNYQINISTQLAISGGANSIQYRLLRNGVVQRVWNFPPGGLNATTVCSVCLSFVVPGINGTEVVWKTQIAALGSNTAVNSYGDANLPRQLSIVDLGTI